MIMEMSDRFKRTGWVRLRLSWCKFDFCGTNLKLRTFDAVFLCFTGLCYKICTTWYKLLCCKKLCHEILPNWLDSPLNVGILVSWYESINQKKQKQWCGKMRFSFITWRGRYNATIVPFGGIGAADLVQVTPRTSHQMFKFILPLKWPVGSYSLPIGGRS